MRWSLAGRVRVAAATLTVAALASCTTANSAAPCDTGSPAGSPGPPVPPTTSSQAAPAAPSKALVIVEENHSLQQMQTGMPYLYGLAQRYAYADHYTAITHPSEPNYVAIAFGDTMGDTADHSTAKTFTGPTVFSQAITAGRTAKLYAESMPSKCKTGDANPYYVKHNPWAFETSPATSGCGSYDTNAGTAAAGNLRSDVDGGGLPNVGMLIPNICNDAHSCPLTTADNWLRSWLPVIMGGPDFTSGNLAVVVTADEDDRNHGNTVLTAVLAAQLDGAHRVVTAPLTHYSLSRWLSQLAGSPPLRNAAAAADMPTAFGL